MSADLATPIRPARRARKSAGERLREALQALAGDHAQITRHEEKAWASITFSGTRHALQMAFEGIDAVEAGEAFVAVLPDYEFAIPGQLVADATIESVEHVLLPGPKMVICCELLLLIDA